MSSVTPRQVERQAARAHAGAERRQDPAPGRIAAEDARLDQAAARDGAREIARHRALGRARHVDHQQLRRPLAVGGDGAGQLAAQPDQRRLQLREVGPVARDRRARPARPLASAITVSLVDMSPSTVMVLNVSSTASASAACSTAGATVASVVMKQSIVAIWGWIIPEPLAIAANLTALPPTSISRNATLVRRSVVRIASAAGMTSSPSAATSAGTAAAIRSTGSGMPIAPVDAVSTAAASTPRPSATAFATARSSTAPRGPDDRVRVAAVGDDGADVRSRAAAPAPKSHGAARIRLTVNTPAAAQGASETMSATSRRAAPACLTPAATAPKRNPTGTVKLFAAVVVMARSQAGSAGQSSRRCPSIRLAFWTAWPAAPLTRLSIAANATATPRSGSASAPSSTRLVPTIGCRRTASGLAARRNGLPATKRSIAAAASAAVLPGFSRP